MYDFYKILEIPRTASAEEIKRAYRSKAKIVHPDVNNSPKANEVFLVINEAYETLIDEHKRYLHDVKLNYVDATKAEAERKKQYYGSSVKNDTYSNTNNFHYDWESYKKMAKEKTDEDYYNQSPWVYNLFFASGMFVGFIIVIVTIVGTYQKLWSTPFVLITIPGIILIREGWKGIMKKESMLKVFLKKFKSPNK